MSRKVRPVSTRPVSQRAVYLGKGLTFTWCYRGSRFEVMVQNSYRRCEFSDMRSVVAFEDEYEPSGYLQGSVLNRTGMMSRRQNGRAFKMFVSAGVRE